MVADQHPGYGRERDDDGNGDRPYADADVADDLPRAFILGDLAIALLIFSARFAHGPHASRVGTRRTDNLVHVCPVVDGCKARSNRSRIPDAR